MKTSGEILQKLKQVKFRHLKRELSKRLRQEPSNCKNNVLVNTPTGQVGVCKIDLQSCDPRFSNRADSCGAFEPLYEKEELKESLVEFFLSRPIHNIAIRFPDVAALLWVVAEDDTVDLSLDVEDMTLFSIPVWLENPEDKKRLRSEVVRLEESIQILRGERDEEISVSENLRRKVGALEAQKADLEEKLRLLREIPAPKVGWLKKVFG